MSTLSMNWKNFLSTEKDRCNKYMLFLLVFSLVNFAADAALIAPDNSLSFLVLPLSLVQIVFSLALIVLTIYIYYKNKVWHFMLRLLPCSLVCLILLGILQAVISPAMLALWVIASIYVNRKYFKPFANYQNYIFRYFVSLILMIFAGVIMFYTALNGTSDSAMSLTLFIGLIEGLAIMALFWQLMSKEIANGKTFYETLRILALLPVAFAFLLTGLLTIVPVRFFAAEHLFGEEGHDYLAMPEANTTA